ncbi:TPA: hypothetical protein ACGD0F_005073, partial [Salmonella enterica]
MIVNDSAYHLFANKNRAECNESRGTEIAKLKISVADFLALIAPYGWSLTPIPWCHEGFWIERDDEEALPLGSTAEHLSGLFYIQEASSMLP